MSSVARSERRGSRRFALGIDVIVRHGGHMLRLLSVNIGSGGIELKRSSANHPSELAVGEAVELEFTLPLLSAPVVVKGEVRWIDGDSCGVQFFNLSPRVVSTINRLQWRSRSV